jgi:hypothetical protein
MNLPKVSNQIASGMISGLVAGILMLSFLSLSYWLSDHNASLPIQLITATYLGDIALLDSSWMQTLIFGVPIHLAACAILGGIFSLIANPERKMPVLLLSIVYGVAIGICLRVVFMPMGLNLALVQRMPPGVFTIAFGIYGAGLMLTLPIYRKIESRYEHSLIAEPLSAETMETLKPANTQEVTRSA